MVSEQVSINLIEALKERFPSEIVNPYGECLVIPSRSFERGWETELANQGYKIFANGRGGESAFFIRLNKPESNREKPEYAYEPQTPPTESTVAVHIVGTHPTATVAAAKPKRRSWTKQEEAKLKELVMQNKSNREIAMVLNRPKFSIVGKVSRMGLANIRPPALPNRSKTSGRATIEGSKQTSKEIVLPVIDNGGDAVKEYLFLANTLYPRYRNSVSVLLLEASRLLNGGK